LHVDYDNDGDVDGADFLLWQQDFGTLYDASNYTDWEGNFGAASPAVVASALVPEPTTLALAALGLSFIAMRRKR